MTFYVYELRDPRCGSVFYIGKGKGQRIYAHEAEARKGVHSAKCQRIREIWAAGKEVRRAKLSLHDEENDALQAEFDAIAAVGLAALTNVLPGGKLGQEAYLKRLAEAEARKAAAEVKVLDRGFRQLAPKFADLLRHNAAGNDYGAWVNGRWLDFREALLSVFHDMVRRLGFDRAKEIMAPHGVELVAG